MSNRPEIDNHCVGLAVNDVCQISRGCDIAKAVIPEQNPVNVYTYNNKAYVVIHNFRDTGH
jgi:hypothetical protein